MRNSCTEVRRYVTLVCLLFATGCVIEPAQPYVALPSPDDLRSRVDTVTRQPTLNLVPRSDQRDQGDDAAERNLSVYRAAGIAVYEEIADPRWQRLAGIFAKVQARSHLSEEKLRVVLVEKSDFQAYTTGGSVIVFYTGLTQRLSDDALAMVIGHEIAHLAAGHIAERSSRDLVNLDTAGTPLMGSYSIADEHEADAVGMVYATLAGYDPGAAAAIWSALAGRSERAIEMFNATHPSDDDRAATLTKHAQKIHALRGTADWRSARECNAIYCAAKN